MLILLCLILHVFAHRRLHHSSVPEDIYAFPKYRLTFLNGLPVLNQTAQRWLTEGLLGGQDEFLEAVVDTTDTKTAISSRASPPLTLPLPTLHHMRLGPQSYLCLIPAPPEIPFPSPEELIQPIMPTKSWELLAPLKGTCIYHRQGWFTYSYCHGQHVRQFRALASPQNTPGGRVPQEDKEEASYTLGHAPSSDVALNDDQSPSNGLEMARGAGHRYLVQRWGEGTVCDKTGRKREIEVQFHCSMTTTDVILFVKETRTCHYTLVIHTPRLCGEPGFKSPKDDLEETVMRCRHIVDSLDRVDKSLPDAPHPSNRLLKPNPPLVEKGRPSEEFIKLAIEALLGEGKSDMVVVVDDENLDDVLRKVAEQQPKEGEELPSHDEL